MKKIKLGLPSKGRLKDKSIEFFKENGFEIMDPNSRNYFFKFKNNTIIEGIYLHAREIIERLNDGTIDIGISGLDLLNENSDDYKKRISLNKKLDFGFATLVVAVPNDWLDVQNMADLEEISFEFREKNNRRLRVATKYPNLTEKFFLSRGVSEYQLVSSLGATESYPFTGSSELITDITSSGTTLKENNLRVISDGQILESSACLFTTNKIKNINLKDLK